jgi:hypothetical protein
LEPRGALRGPLAAVGAELSAIGWALTLGRRATRVIDAVVSALIYRHVTADGLLTRLADDH